MVRLGIPLICNVVKNVEVKSAWNLQFVLIKAVLMKVLLVERRSAYLLKDVLIRNVKV